jgi:hypothetical protein
MTYGIGDGTSIFAWNLTLSDGVFYDMNLI